MLQNIQLNNNNTQHLRVKTEDGGSRQSYLRKIKNNGRSSPDQQAILNYAQLRMTKFQSIISPGFKPGSKLNFKNFKNTKDNTEERVRSQEKCLQLMNEVFEKSSDNFNPQLYKKFNLSEIKQNERRHERPKCNNLMLKYDEKILKQEVKALDPNAYLIRQQEHEFNTKTLYSLNVANTKTIQQMMQSYCIHSNQNNIQIKQNTSTNKSSKIPLDSSSFQNSPTQQLSYQRLHSRLKNFQKNEKCNDVTEITFQTQDSPFRAKQSFINFFDDKENIYDYSKSIPTQNKINGFQDNSPLQGLDHQAFQIECESRQTDRANSTPGLSFEEISEEDKKKIEQMKADMEDPRFELYTIDGKIQGKYNKVYTYLSNRVQEAEQKKKQKTYKIYHNQGINLVNKSVGQSIQSERNIESKIEFSEQKQQDEQNDGSSPSSPINPNLFKRYKYILSSPETSPQKFNKSVNYSKNTSFELEDLQSAQLKKKISGKDDQFTLRLFSRQESINPQKELTPIEKAELFISQKLKELNKIDESRIKRLQKIELHKEKEFWLNLQKGQLSEEQINKLLNQQQEEEKKKKEQLKDQIEKEKIVKLRDIQNIQQFYGGSKPSFIGSEVVSKRNSLRSYLYQTTTENSPHSSKTQSKQNISSDQIIEPSNQLSQVAFPKKKKVLKTNNTKFNMAHLYLNNDNDEEEIKRKRQEKAQQYEENQKNGISQVVDLRSNILRIQKNLYKKRNVKLYMLSQHKLDQEFDVVCKDLQMIVDKNKQPIMRQSSQENKLIQNKLQSRQ